MRTRGAALGERSMTTQTAVEQQEDLGSLIDLYLLRCQVGGESPDTMFLPSRLSRVRFPSPAPSRTRRYSACNARVAEGRSPASEAGRLTLFMAGVTDS
jgi:hypothetical protein